MFHKCIRMLFIVAYASVFNSAISQAEDATNPVFKGKKLLLIAAISSHTGVVDANIKKHFESLGMSVNIVSATNPPSEEGYDLVFLSSDVKAKAITNAYRTAKVPVFTAKPWLLDFLGMTGYQPQKDYGEDEKEEQSFLWLVNAPNPIQAGFPNGMFMPVKHAIKIYNWGRPEPSAQVIAFLPGEPEKGSSSHMKRASTWTTSSPRLRDGSSSASRRTSLIFLFQMVCACLIPAPPGHWAESK